MSRAFKLFRLQQVDSQLDQARARLDEIQTILGGDEELRAAQKSEEAAQEAQSAAAKELRRAEEDVQAQQAKIEQNQKTLYGGSVTNPKELEDLQLEAQALQRHLENLENVQLEKMVAEEEARSTLDKARRKLQQTQSARAKEHGELGEEQEQLFAEVERLKEERAAVERGVQEEDLGVYGKIRGDKGGLAIAKVQDKTCSACGTKLSASLAQAARSPNDLSRCSTCKRILYSG